MADAVDEFEARIRTAGGAETLHRIAEDVSGAELTDRQREALQRMFAARCAELWPRQCGRRG